MSDQLWPVLLCLLIGGAVFMLQQRQLDILANRVQILEQRVVNDGTREAAREMR
jgi:hypothetical protein